MPDVEVKLNIEAEYKQALAAIAAMGKALEAVQAKAKALTDATKNVAAVSGAGGGQNEALTATQKLNEASKQLAGHLAQVAVASTKAKDSLQAIAGIEPYREESLELINKAAAGYEKLASMAQMAANAAERFRKVGADGLTTEEMVRQTQAAEKQLETLRAQSVELERSIAAQREQLNVLRETTAEQQKQAQVRSAEDKEREKSIAIREREAKAEEEADFKMKLSGKTRLELVAIYKELAQKAKEASAAQDHEAAAKYERQMQLVNQTLRKVNTSTRIANIAFMQQAQAAQRIGQNIAALSKEFSEFGESLKNGTLNLAGMASEFSSLIYSLKGGISPIGAAILALQGLQAVYNEHAKREKSIAESARLHKEAVRATADAYKAVKTAREAYLRQEERERSINDLNAQYQSLNTTLQTGLDLINAQTAAELRRLQLTQDDAKFQQTLKKHELGRQLALGTISEDDYRLALLNLDKDMAVGTAKSKMSQSKTKKEAAEGKSKEINERFKIVDKMYKQADYDAAQYTVSNEELDAAEEKIKELEEKQAEARKKLEEVFKKYNINYRGYLSAMGEGFQWFAQEALGRTLINNLLGTDFQGVYEEAQQDIKTAQNAYSEATSGLIGFKSDVKKQMGGKSFSDYRADKKEAEDKLVIATRNRQEIGKQAQTAAKEASEARTAYNDSVHSLNKVTWQQNELIKSEEKNIEARKEGEAKKQREAQKLEELQNIANSLTAKQLKEEIKAAQEDANSTNKIVAEEGKKRLSYLVGVSNARQNRAAKETAKYLGDNKFTSKEVQAVISKLEEAVYAGEVEKVELYRSILKLGKKVLENKKDTKNINKQLEETAR